MFNVFSRDIIRVIYSTQKNICLCQLAHGKHWTRRVTCEIEPDPVNFNKITTFGYKITLVVLYLSPLLINYCK